MEISKTLEEALEIKNVGRIRSVFYTIAHEDPSFSSGKFRAILNFVKSKNISGLFDVYDGGEFKNESEWTDEYWADVASELVDNFCEERITHLQNVGEKLYSVSIKKNEPALQKNNATERQLIRIKNYQQKKEVVKLIGIVAVAVVVAIIVILLNVLL